MHKLLSSFIFILLITNSAIAQDTCRKITFQRAYQISITSAPYEVMQTKDSGYLITGPQTEVPVGNGDGFLLKTNKYGESQWIKAYNRTDADYVLFSSAQLSDSGYMSVVYLTESQTGLQKTDKNGNLVWQKRFGVPSGSISFEKIASTSDNAVIVIGYLTEATSYGGTLIIKLDEDGNIIWQKLVSNGGHSNYSAGVIIKEDTILVHGVLPSSYPPAPDSVYITKMALADGAIYQSKRIWHGEGSVVGNHSFIKRSDGNYVLSIVFFETSGDVDNIILGVDQNFNLIRSDKLINIVPGAPFTGSPSPDNGFVLVYGLFDLTVSYFIKFDQSHIPQFGKYYTPSYGNDPFYYFLSIKPTNDSGYVIGG